MASEVESVGVQRAREEIAGGDAIAADVRSEDEWSQGHVPGAIRFPDGDPEQATKRPEEGARLIVIATDGKRAKEAASKLADVGYETVALDGDMVEWVSGGFQIQPTPDPDPGTELGLE